ncbi:hypothetical protein GBA52_020710 [Prunus armeniaca]|nr:hypothetical protein GBA52_020710 [Prunus armeniaca]
MYLKDVFAVPVSTVASESAFSTGGRIIDHFRSSLTPKMVEALTCGQNWLRSFPIYHWTVNYLLKRWNFMSKSSQLGLLS